MSQETPALERALIARVAQRVAAAGRTIEPGALEHIVREVLAGLAAADASSVDPAPTIMVFVLESPNGDRAWNGLQRSVEEAARRHGASVLAAHRESGRGSADPVAPSRLTAGGPGRHLVE